MGRLARTDASPPKANNVRRTASDAGQATSPRNLSRLPTSVRSGAVLRRARGTVDSLPLPRSRTELRNRSARGPEPAVRLPASSRPRGYGCVRLLHRPPPLRGPVAEVLLEVGRTRAGSSRLEEHQPAPAPDRSSAGPGCARSKAHDAESVILGVSRIGERAHHSLHAAPWADPRKPPRPRKPTAGLNVEARHQGEGSGPGTMLPAASMARRGS